VTLYRVAPDRFESVPRTTFAAASLLERRDLQRLLRRDISPVGDDLMVIAEEYGDWEDSNRRIDLLCLSKDADLVVVEIKRTEDGGHMELQAIRYAAMVSGMTFEQAVHAYARTSGLETEPAQAALLDFLQLDSDEVAQLSGEVRIILVSADFSTELTTAVLWLNEHDLDITCLRLRPYRLGNDVLIDATQIIPLPEAADYAVKVRAQEHEKRKVLGNRQETLRRFWTQLIERSKARTQLLAGRSTTTDHWLSTGTGRGGFSLTLTLKQYETQVECYIKLPSGKEKSLEVFRRFFQQKEQIEGQFGGPLDWEELEDRQGCRICARYPGGWRSPESEWVEIQDRAIDALIRLEGALRKPISEISV
jgi:hypothetical protein